MKWNKPGGIMETPKIPPSDLKKPVPRPRPSKPRMGNLEWVDIKKTQPEDGVYICKIDYRGRISGGGIPGKEYKTLGIMCLESHSDSLGNKYFDITVKALGGPENIGPGDVTHWAKEI